MSEPPVCGGKVVISGLPCHFPGKYSGYCGFHRLCDAIGCDRPRWWDCSPDTWCRKHAEEHAGRCRHCGDHLRQVITKYRF